MVSSPPRFVCLTWKWCIFVFPFLLQSITVCVNTVAIILSEFLLHPPSPVPCQTMPSFKSSTVSWGIISILLWNNSFLCYIPASALDLGAVPRVKEVKVVDVGINSITLSWKHTPGASGYKVSWIPFLGVKADLSLLFSKAGQRF